MKCDVLRAMMFCIMAGGIGTAPVHAEEAACHLRRIAFLDMSMDHYGRPVIPVSIKNTTEHFLVDTAGVYSGIAPKTADTLKLDVRRFKTHLEHMVSGEVADHIATVDDLKIGHLPVPHMGLVVMTPSSIAHDSQGMISGDILHAFDVEFDPAGKKLSLFLQNSCGERVVHWTNAPRAVLPFQINKRGHDSAALMVRTGRDWHIRVPAKLDGHDVDLVIDSGASNSVMRYGDAEKLFAPGAEKKLVRINKDEKNADPVYRYVFGTLDMAGIGVRNTEVVLLPGDRDFTEKAMYPNPELVLGDNVLMKLHFYVSYGEKKLYITAASAH